MAVLIFCGLTNVLLAQKSLDIKLANEYYSQGELLKAKGMYSELSKNLKNIPLIHNNYLFILIETSDFKTAERYVSRLIKKFPQNLYYELDLGLVYWNQGEQDLAHIWFTDIIQNIKRDNYKTRITAQYFVSKQLTSYAVMMFAESREVAANPYLYALELANIYRITGEKDLMVEEYLNYIIQNPSNMSYVKNTLQNLLSKPEELESLEMLLYQKIQDYPENIVYSELLIWVSLQQKNFYGAFIQARALDKRLKTEGARSNRIGLISLQNNDFDVAITIFTYVIKHYPKSVNYMRAKMYLIQAYEERVRATYPVDEREIRNLVYDYRLFIKEMGINRNTLEALRNKAHLHAFYLDEKDSAIQILNDIIKTPRADHKIKSKSKMDLGDIHLLLNEPWESVLYYAQVEKSNKDTKIGYEAKLKNAKLSYYKGDFALAQEHLDILKQATTREIANDAMQLSILIKDNIALDSTTEAMEEYASIDLLLFQNKFEEAIAAVKSLKGKYKGHSLMDEILWLEAKINIDLGNFEYSADLLDQISTNYAYDIWSDDAHFKLGDLYQNQIGDLDRAKEIFHEFLTKYPGSVYVSEARKRFRELRGDFKPKEEVFTEEEVNN
jgi:outer membrane protein assembly factor BamD (BamD/ComL family)